MRKFISIFLINLVITGIAVAQNLDWGNFENDSSMWDNWGGTDTVVNNPHPQGINTSSKVLQYNPDSVWRGISHWWQDSILSPEHKTISLDVYVEDTTVLQLALLTPVIIDEIFVKDTILPGAWKHVVFDISNRPITSYQHIAFQTSEVTTYYFDNIKVNTESAEDSNWTRFDVKNIVFGSVTDSTDFSAYALMKWDADSLHMFFHVIDDSIVTTGATYQVDNIELYLDLDNSKRVHWPRNGGWMNNDTTFDKNDHQLRLVPGKEWNYTTENQKIGGANYSYSIDSAGYSFHVSIPWDSLMMGFVPTVSTLIGFDLLISDNDAVASDANRNQITFNSPTTFPFNDPSLWATLRLDSVGKFTVIPDTIAPVAPANLVATANGKQVTLIWNPSTDNTSVQYYIILQDSAVIDTVLALKANNKYVVSNLDSGTYMFSVVALDIYNNASDTSASASVTIQNVNVKNSSLAEVQLYPNPSAENIKISNIKNGPASIAIYNSNGQLILKQTVLNDQQVSISKLSKGTYVVKVESNSESKTIKLIKK